MSLKGFILGFLILVSVDVIVGFIIYIFWKYLDMKYFSKLDISILREENEYLKKENRKINGTGTNFWSDKND